MGRALLAALAALLALASTTNALSTGRYIDRYPPGSSERSGGGLVIPPGGVVPGTNVAVGQWAEYSNYYFLEENPGFVTGPVDDCYCKGWSDT